MKKIGFLCLMLLLCIGFTGNKAKTEAASKTKLKTSESTIFINEKYTIPLTGKLKKATYIFTSNKTKIAKVNSKGVITGINSGSASIKIRYKYKGDFYSVGTFKITIHKSSLNTKYKAMDMLTGDTLNPSVYLDGINPNASYIITSSVSAVAKGGSDGVITAKKAGRTAISIHEVYNNRSRKVGSIALSVSGASLKRDEIKMAYNSNINITDLLDDMDSTSKYALTSDNLSLVTTSNTRISAASRGKGVQTCLVTVDETLSNKTKHTIGSFKVNLTDETFISFINKDILIGFGEVITVGNTGIVIQNKVAGAQYKLTPKDASVLKTEEIKNRSTNLEAIGYGITSVSIEEIRGGKTRLLEDTVDVTVSQAYILKDLADNGYEVSIGSNDTFGRYPFECRNLKAVYDYTSASSNICGVGSAGMNKDQDYLVITPKKVGTTEISVYETMVNTNAQTKTTTRSRKKIGSFNITVRESGYKPSYTPVPGSSNTPKPGTSSTPPPGSSNTPRPPRPSSNPGGTDISLEDFLENPVASNIISSIRLDYNNKTYYGYVSDMGLECLFGDDDNYSDYIDYGTNFDNISINDFTITLANSSYDFVSLESYGGTEWTLSVQLNDEDNTIEEIPIYLNSAEFDTNSILSDITVKVGGATRHIPSSPYPAKSSLNDDDINQFEDGNKEFQAYFTPREYEKAGSDEYYDLIHSDDPDYPDRYPEDPKTLSDLTNVSCTYTESGGNAAVKSISRPVTDDNYYWTFEVEFEDGTTEEFSISIEVDDEGY
ncbi:MAG: hypothetical protein K1W06_01095 [Lachnospiraceae bacterium]